MKPSEKIGSRAVPTASATIAAMLADTQMAVRRSMRLLPSTTERYSPAAGTTQGLGWRDLALHSQVQHPA